MSYLQKLWKYKKKNQLGGNISPQQCNLHIGDKFIGNLQNGFELNKSKITALKDSTNTKYIILGEGTFGQVIKGRYTTETESIFIAIKIIKHQINNVNMKALCSELFLLTQYAGEYVAKYYGYGVENDKLYIFMEYIDGIELFDYIREKHNNYFDQFNIKYKEEYEKEKQYQIRIYARNSEETDEAFNNRFNIDFENFFKEHDNAIQINIMKFVIKHNTPFVKQYFPVLTIIKNLIQGLIQIHAQDIVHRDIKPENIMISKNELTVKYIDFGLGCHIEKSCEHASQTVGTPDYMAYDIWYQNMNFLQNLKTHDIWALGCTIFTLLTGKSFNKNEKKLRTEINEINKNIQLTKEEKAQKILEAKRVNLNLYHKQINKDSNTLFTETDNRLNSSFLFHMLEPYERECIRMILFCFLQTDPKKRILDAGFASFELFDKQIYEKYYVDEVIVQQVVVNHEVNYISEYKKIINIIQIQYKLQEIQNIQKLISFEIKQCKNISLNFENLLIAYKQFSGWVKEIGHYARYNNSVVEKLLFFFNNCLETIKSIHNNNISGIQINDGKEIYFYGDKIIILFTALLNSVQNNTKQYDDYVQLYNLAEKLFKLDNSNISNELKIKIVTLLKNIETRMNSAKQFVETQVPVPLQIPAFTEQTDKPIIAKPIALAMQLKNPNRENLDRENTSFHFANTSELIM
jgi:serine/threonine protein kinase